MAKRVNSARKGKSAERELARELRKWVDEDGKPIIARRGQQYKGGADSPDIVHGIPDAHIECKAVKGMGVGTVLLAQAIEQSETESLFPKIAFVIWKEHRKGWRVSRHESPTKEAIWTTTLGAWLEGKGYKRVTT